MELRWRVRELADERDWDTADLAREADLDEKTVRNILAGRTTRIDLRTIARLAEALGIQPGALWDVRPEPAWKQTAGSAGQASNEEVDAALCGRLEPDPGLDRSLRS